MDVNELGVDLLTIAGHKLYAPKGVGALFVRRGVQLEPLIHGAGHESGRRAGTENMPYIVGLGKAAEIARESLPAATEKLKRLRDRLHEKLKATLGEKLVLNGHPEKRLPNTLNVSFLGHIGSELLAKSAGDRGVDRVGVSRGEDRALAGAVRDERPTGREPRRRAADRGAIHDRRGSGPRGGGAGEGWRVRPNPPAPFRS